MLIKKLYNLIEKVLNQMITCLSWTGKALFFYSTYTVFLELNQYYAVGSYAQEYSRILGDTEIHVD